MGYLNTKARMKEEWIELAIKRKLKDQKRLEDEKRASEEMTKKIKEQKEVIRTKCKD